MGQNIERRIGKKPDAKSPIILGLREQSKSGYGAQKCGIWLFNFFYFFSPIQF
jgi:hypothetical protein